MLILAAKLQVYPLGGRPWALHLNYPMVIQITNEMIHDTNWMLQIESHWVLF